MERFSHMTVSETGLLSNSEKSSLSSRLTWGDHRACATEVDSIGPRKKSFPTKADLKHRNLSIAQSVSALDFSHLLIINQLVPHTSRQSRPRDNPTKD